MWLYVTKWVLARGILLVEGTRPCHRGRSLNLYSSVSGVGRRMSTVALGSEAFLTLEEAQANARERFETRLQRALVEHLEAQGAWDRIRNGVPVKIHKNPKEVSKCRPFMSQKGRARLR